MSQLENRWIATGAVDNRTLNNDATYNMAGLNLDHGTGNLYVKGDSSMAGNLMVDGTTTFNSGVNFGSDSTLTGNLYVGGNLGIGITNPTANRIMVKTTGNLGLELNDGASPDNRLIIVPDTVTDHKWAIKAVKSSGNTYPITFFSDSYERVRIMPDGKVGIGITVPVTVLHVNGTITVDGNGVYRTTNDLDVNGCLYLSFQDNSTGTYVERAWVGFGVGDKSFGVRNNVSGGSLILYTNATERLRITDTGNVGVNITTPVSITGSDKFIHTHGSSSSSIVLSESNTGSSKSWEILHDGQKRLRFYSSDGGDTLCLDSMANIGIGGITSPTERVDVAGIIQTNSGYKISSAYLASASGGNNYVYSRTGGNLIFVNGAGSSNLMTLTDSGDVGIGTTIPISRLTLGPNADGDEYVSLRGNRTSFGYSSAENAAVLVGGSGKAVILKPNSVAAVTIDTNGRMGIGIAPSYTLDVNGQARISNVPAYGSTASVFLTQVGGVLQSRTATQVRSDISAEPAISAGTTSQYWRGDKTWQTLNTAAVPESSNLYFTDARARNAVITGMSNTQVPRYNGTNLVSGMITDTGSAVGINTASPDSLLTVKATTAATQNIIYVKNNANYGVVSIGKSAEYGLMNVYDSTGNSLIQLYAHSSGISYFNNKHVGIGTNDPSIFYNGANKLVIYDSAATTGMTIRGLSTGAGIINFVATNSSSPQGLIYYDYFTDSMRFDCAGTEIMRLWNDKVGIGTNNPGVRFHVRDNQTGVNNILLLVENVGIGTTTTNATSQRIRHHFSSSSPYYRDLELGINGNGTAYLWGKDSNHQIILDGNTNILTFQETGNDLARIKFLVGNPGVTVLDMISQALFVNRLISFENAASDKAFICFKGGGQASSATAITETASLYSYSNSPYWRTGSSNYYINMSVVSDERIKEDVKPIIGSLDKVMVLNPITFKYKEDFVRGGVPGHTVDNNPRSIGLIAQEVEKVIPEVVSQTRIGLIDKEGKLTEMNDGRTLDYEKLVPVLVGAIKELKMEIDALKAKIS